MVVRMEILATRPTTIRMMPRMIKVWLPVPSGIVLRLRPGSWVVSADLRNYFQ
jgi:hypothetical protein